MQISPGLVANLPDAVAMPVMLGFLVSLRSRHAKLDTRSWLVALGFLFLSQATWVVTGHLQMQQTLVVIGELLAGIAFASYRGGSGSYRMFDLPYLLLNSLALAGIEGLYGYGETRRLPYLAMIASGFALLAFSAWWRRQDVRRAWWAAALLALLALPLAAGWNEAAAYCLLAAVYGYAGWNFYRRLPKKSVGRVAVVASMALLAVCYAGHPWVTQHEEYGALATELWRMQKFFVLVGMLLVLVENQSARHQYLAMHDQLTGLPNRRMLDTWLTSEIEWAQRSGNRLTLIMMDLNGFKQVNDTHGHLAGDHLLHQIAKRLRMHLRPADLVARMGGDEFVIITRSAVSETLVRALEARLRRWVREPVEWDGKRLWVDGSMGSARFPEDVARWSDDVTQDSADRLAGAMLRIADLRMYAQKPSSQAGLAELETLFPARTLIH